MVTMVAVAAFLELNNMYNEKLFDVDAPVTGLLTLVDSLHEPVRRQLYGDIWLALHFVLSRPDFTKIDLPLQVSNTSPIREAESGRSGATA